MRLLKNNFYAEIDLRVHFFVFVFISLKIFLKNLNFIYLFKINMFLVFLNYFNM
jgi:hypothetical protein